MDICKVRCKNCQANEPVHSFGHLPRYMCHRHAGPPKEVPLDHWCYEGIYKYGDNGGKNENTNKRS